jgi:hypothetical protein
MRFLVLLIVPTLPNHRSQAALDAAILAMLLMILETVFA